MHFAWTLKRQSASVQPFSFQKRGGIRAKSGKKRIIARKFPSFTRKKEKSAYLARSLLNKEYRTLPEGDHHETNHI
jgi:hypothetical protein